MNQNMPEPIDVWKYFSEICKIPRPSKHEEKITAYLIQFAQNNHLEYKQDEVGNVLIKKAGVGHTIILQAHTDMVCEKNDNVVHDFMVNPISFTQNGDWISANGTTLGADDGIGVAMMLALLAGNKTKRSLECLFTIDEETGLTGASALKDDFISADSLINLDSETDDEIIIGCAGGCDSTLTFFIEKEPIRDHLFGVSLKIFGLQGGHSGDDINKDRANANKLLNDFLNSVSKQFDLSVCSINGGGLRNAIARESSAIIAVPWADKERIRIAWNIFCAETEDNWIKKEPGMKFSLDSCKVPDTRIKHEDALNIIHAISECPHGVLEYSSEIPELVETSTNLASIKTLENSIVICTSQRSDYVDKLHKAASMIDKIATTHKASVTHSNEYPGWKPNFESPLLKKADNIYKQLFKKAPKIKVIHAGLECGLFLQKFPHLDIISIGPNLEGVHSPDERVSVSSVEKIWEYLIELLK
ncbi:MAG: aminoacyl-histidine dipeptidase [Bacteroidia bacterium]|nr:aminoacyl-histidine dipeptidase [Bacteroidia bacterium]